MRKAEGGSQPKHWKQQARGGTCLGTRVGGGLAGRWVHPTVPSATRLCGLTTSVATLALVVVALAGSASRGPLGLVRILGKERGPLTSLLSSEASRLRPIMRGSPSLLLLLLLMLIDG
ncbi:hypothetical protein SKAU_G00129760 [Synaphobranchus kaupii]|uniref:Uncharacterized protein n=1 Tax=Synaphobranchus kaupii TaxID=118154 RepID=A0A9Q1J3B9_SYNKA|nr:hypothetical protein SKAU_G00129760 [Synaphobranchus kaupii]